MISVGITERHGISDEYAKHPPKGVEYSFVEAKNRYFNKLITSSAKGVYDYFDNENIDIYEAPLFPILTKKNWIYTPAEFSGTANFGFCGLPLPKSVRLNAILHLFKKDNFKKLIFKSNAGLKTLQSYGGAVGDKLLSKSCVVSPAISPQKVDVTRFGNTPQNLLFSGDFFRKGGANVVDAYVELSTEYPNLTLTLCCADHLHTTNESLREKYLKIIRSHPRIKIGKVSREQMLGTILPQTDIFLSPTYQETFGFAILEAMSFGIPTITSDVFAIPEIIDNKQDGIMLPIKDEAYIREFKGYSVDTIPDSFHKYVSDTLTIELGSLLNDRNARTRLSANAIKKCREKFSPQHRADKMLEIYSAI